MDFPLKRLHLPVSLPGNFGLSPRMPGDTAGGMAELLRGSGAGWGGLQLCVEERDLLQDSVNDVLVAETRVDH